MADSSASSASPRTSSSSESLKKSSAAPPYNAASTAATGKEGGTSWRDKFRKQPKEPGKEAWRDASLSEEDRWKEWQKAKDKEQAKGSTAGFYTDFYKKKGSVGYWLDMFL